MLTDRQQKNEAQLAARTGAVKVKPLDEDDYEEIISAAAINMRKATSGPRGQLITVQDSLDWWVMKETERRILSALSPAPEAQQEPHEVLHVYDGDGGVIIRENGNISTFGAQTPAVHAAFEAASDAEAQQEPVAHAYVVNGECEQIEWGMDVGLPNDPSLVLLYTRPAEQVVTDAMVEAAQRIRDVAMRQTIAARLPECGEFGGIAQDADWLVDALKAAMEAKG